MCVFSCRSDLALSPLFQAESNNAELALLLRKLQAEDATLRDSLVKISGLNEALAQDKVDLNAYILKVKSHFCVKSPM